MPFVKGSNHSAETRAKMSASHKGKPHSDDRKKKIGDANRGKVVPKKYSRICACGTPFMSGASNAIYCSTKCKRATYGHGMRHSLSFAHFPKHCAICGSHKQLVGDHNHQTGKPRGILCRNCNLAIGNMFDNPERLRAAAIYLENSL